MFKFKFADIGEGLHEGTVGEIYVKEGDTVKEGDSLFQVETDKITSDIPSPTHGTVVKILIKQGETVHVGDEIFNIDDGSAGETPQVEETPKEEIKTPEVKEEVKPVETKEVKAAPIAESQASSTKRVMSNSGKNVLATPYARKLAVEKNIDINSIKGTGFNGRILAKDIEGIVNNSPLISSPNIHTQTGDFPSVNIKDSGVRKAIAKAMKTSWDNIAYTELVNEVNMTKLWDERKALVKETEELYGVKVSFTALIALAVVKVLRKYPVFNAKHDEENNAIVGQPYVNLGIAVDTPRGLYVPVIKNAHTKNIVQMAQEIITLAKKARDGQLTMDEMSDATFTISNYGAAGAMWGIPIINYPEIAILGTGTIVDRVYGDANGNFYNGKVMNLTLAADHRWVDGADVGRFLVEAKKLLENPILLLGGI